MARKSSSTTPTDKADTPGAQPRALSDLKLITPGSVDTPQNTAAATASLSAKNNDTNEEVHGIQVSHDTSFHNAGANKNQNALDDETKFWRAHQETGNDEKADTSNNPPPRRWSEMLPTEAVAALALHFGHHHWIRDIWRVEKLAKDARKVDRAVHDGKDAKKAHDAEKDIKDAKTGEKLEHDAKLIDKAGTDLGKLGKDAHLIDAMKHAEHLGKTLKHVVAIGGIASVGVGGFLLKRYIQGELMRSVAKLELSDKKADAMAWDVSTRTILSRDAQNKLDKGDVSGAIDATIQPKIDDAKDAIKYLSDTDKVNKDFAEIQTDIDAIMKVYDKDPAKAQQLLVAAADQAGLLEGVVLKDGKLSAETLHNAFMGNKDGTKQNLNDLKTAYLAQPNPTLDKDKGAIQGAFDAIIKAKADGAGGSMPTVTQPKPAGRLASDQPNPTDKLG